MDRLFELPWYKIGLYGNKDAEERDQVVSEKMQMVEEMHGTAAHQETVDKSTRV
jgi:hypothetical protein